MRKMRLSLCCALASLLMAGLGAAAQTKGETSLYTKTMKKPSVKAAEKFLKKYSASVYAPQVVRMRDSIVFFAMDPEDAAAVLAFKDAYPESPFKGQAEERIRRHNTSGITREEALQAAGECLDAVGWRKDNVEHILVLDKGFTIRILSKDGVLEATHSIPVYTLLDTPVEPVLTGPAEITAPSGTRNYLHFAYRNGDTEYVEVLYLPDQDLLHQALFYGNALPEGRIEGQSPEMMEGVLSTAEVAWITNRFRENPALVPIAKADILSDDAIRWWRQKNPKAETTANKVTFGKLDPESSLVAAYKKASKEKGKNSNVAQFDLRGYTVLVAASKTSGEYSLIWCEPVCKNKKRDKYIRAIYFESDGTTLDMVYYQGNTTFKIKISLPSHTLYHTK